MKSLYLGCTKFRHDQLGVNAVINARAGRQDLNDKGQEQIEMERDAQKIQDRLQRRIRFYQFNSIFFRRHQSRLAHLLSSYDD